MRGEPYENKSATSPNVSEFAYMDAMDWNAARLTATMPIRVGSEKWATSKGDGPLRYAL
jgi:hypothetical protein